MEGVYASHPTLSVRWQQFDKSQLMKNGRTDFALAPDPSSIAVYLFLARTCQVTFCIEQQVSRGLMMCHHARLPTRRRRIVHWFLLHPWPWCHFGDWLEVHDDVKPKEHGKHNRSNIISPSLGINCMHKHNERNAAYTCNATRSAVMQPACVASRISWKWRLCNKRVLVQVLVSLNWNETKNCRRPPVDGPAERWRDMMATLCSIICTASWMQADNRVWGGS